MSELTASKVWQSGQLSLLSLLIIPEMTEEAEKLLHPGEEEKDDEKEVVEEKEDVKGEIEMKTDTYDLLILGASGFTGNYMKINIKTKQYHVNSPLQASMWSSMCSEL